MAFVIGVALLSLNTTDRGEAAESDGFATPAAGAITSGVAGFSDPDELVESLLFQVQSISIYDIGTQRFRVFIPGAPAVVNASSRELFHTGSIVWVRRGESDSTNPPTATGFSDSSGSSVSDPADAGDASSVKLGAQEIPETFPIPAPGQLTFGVSGTSNPSALVAAQLFDVAAIMMLEVSTQRFRTYIPGAPDVVNTLTSNELRPSNIVWIRRANTTRIVAAPAVPSADGASTPTPTALQSFGAAPPPTASSTPTATPSPELGTTPTPTPTPTLSPTSAPTPTPTPTSTPGCDAVSDDLLSILDRRIGYAASATGGATGCVYHVTHNGDSGPGSLRDGATSGASWVVFDGDFEISMASRLNVAANTTIDGRGHLITIHGEIYIPSNNVIVTNLVMNNYTGNEYLDAIGIQGIDATNIWLDHISFDITPDELLPLWAWPTADYAPGDITVTWSRFGRLGNSPSSTQGGSHGALIGVQNEDGSGSSRTHLTLAFNMFETQSRAPLIGDGAKAHIFNNLYDDWGYYAIQARRNGQVRSEHNIFARNGGGAAGARAFWVVEHTLMGGEVISDDGSWFPNGASGTERNADAVFAPPYAYSLSPADAALMSSIQTAAGATLQ